MTAIGYMDVPRSHPQRGEAGCPIPIIGQIIKMEAADRIDGRFLPTAVRTQTGIS